MLPFTEQTKQQEWNVIFTIARNNGLPLQIICNLKNKLILKTQQTITTPTQTQKKEWDTSHITVHLYTGSPIYLNIPFRTTNTLYNKLSNKVLQNKMNSSGMYRLKCKTCISSCVGQTDRSIGITHREHTRHIKTNTQFQHMHCIF
jgi:hypothetical protein